MRKLTESVRRQWRLGEFRLLAVSLLVVTATLVATGQFTSRVDLAMQNRASGLLGADAVLSSSRPIPPEYRKRADEFGLETATSLSFITMLLSDDGGQLASVRAVSDNYPLRGEVVLGESLSPALVSGEAWLATALIRTLGLALGQTVYLGDAEFRVTGRIELEPGGDPGAFRIAPSVMINTEDVERTGLIPKALLLHPTDSHQQIDLLGRLRCRIRQCSSVTSRSAGVQSAETMAPFYSMARSWTMCRVRPD